MPCQPGSTCQYQTFQISTIDLQAAPMNRRIPAADERFFYICVAGTEQRPSHHTYDGSDEPGVLSAGAIRPFRDEVSITLDCRSTCTNNSYRLASPSWADIKILRRRLSQRFIYSNERRMVLPEATRKLVHFVITIAASRLRLLQPRGLTAWSLITVIKIGKRYVKSLFQVH